MEIDDMIEICKRHIASEDLDVVITEPYIPHIPDKWNGFLVLAESQNLSNTNSSYVEKLKSMTSNERILRLQSEEDLGIQPWDDGSLKLAIESAFNVTAEDTAVTNSIFWSQIDKFGNNRTPSSQLIDLSIKLWTDLLPLIKPIHIVTSGNISKRVIEEVKKAIGQSLHHTPLRLPSRTAMSRVSGMFSENDLLSRYPEVKRVKENHPDWLEGGYQLNKIFFACHAVSVAKST